MRCGRCGNENSEANRYCGMCGAPLIAVAAKPTQAAGKPTQFVSTENVTAARPAAVSAPVAASPVPTAPRAATAGVPTGGNSVSAERRPAPVSSPEVGRSAGPVITGPSFLGLSTPGPARTGIRSEYSDHHSDYDSGDRRDDGGHDRLRPSSGNLDYLLDDEEEPKRGPGKLILIVIALVLAGGFGYLHWKQGGFDWLNAAQKKPAASAPAPDATQSGADSGNASSAAASAPAPGADSAGSQSGPNGGAGAAPAASGAGAAPGDSSAVPTTATQSAPQSAAPQGSAPQSKTGDSNAPTDSGAGDSAAPAASTDAEKPAAADEPAAHVRPRTRTPAVVAKPAAGRPFDMVSEGERYVYGRGVRQDCDHGTRLLKSAAEQSNPKAMISLGALYSTGTCTPRDLPTAYRWFALALHQQPDNQALQDDLQKLWSQMTQPERQLAIKLSQ